ncbi:hypothetical protein BYT27DRAFT_7208642 [Phlegmacium glaucopus]|nr:hypothetical protein BYT27DRAFT_7208642 [Phlegmacium glaucopus]
MFQPGLAQKLRLWPHKNLGQAKAPKASLAQATAFDSNSTIKIMEIQKKNILDGLPWIAALSPQNLGKDKDQQSNSASESPKIKEIQMVWHMRHCDMRVHIVRIRVGVWYISINGKRANIFGAKAMA